MDFKCSPELSPFLLSNVVRTGVTLGMGSFGIVEEVNMNGAPCAGKKMHDALMQSQCQDYASIVKKMVSECQLMSELKHPNVVQFFGLCFFENSHFPTIIMEKLNSNLDAILTGGERLTLPLKNILMQDIAKGLNYLHSQVPPIIHRDLTARNVLLTSSMTAKLGDLGNSRIVQHGISRSLTQMPGTMVYMPPEALHPTPNYDTALDMFSFGHLILFIILQELPWNLLPYTYQLPNSKGLVARSEVERRREYIDRCILTLGHTNPIIALLCHCLSNDPSGRPSAKMVLEKLVETELAQKQVFNTLRRRLHFHAADVLGFGNGQDETDARQESSHHLNQHTLHQIMSGEPMLLDKMHTRQGFLKREKQAVWEQYLFQLEASSHLKYFSDLKKKKTLGQIELACVTDVIKQSPQSCSYPFEVHFNGRGSPWTVRAKTEDARNCWMESIKKDSSLQPEFATSSSQEEAPQLKIIGTDNQTLMYDSPNCPPAITENSNTPNANEVEYEVVKPQPLSEPTSKEERKIGYNVPLPGDYSDLSDEQLDHLYQTLSKIMQQRQNKEDKTTEVYFKGSDESRNTDSEQTLKIKPLPLPRRANNDKRAVGIPERQDKDDRQFSDSENFSSQEPKPPPLPPKKKNLTRSQHRRNEEPPQMAAPLPESQPESQFRERAMAGDSSRRSKSIRKIMKITTQLNAHMDPLKEGEEECPDWGRVSIYPDTTVMNNEDFELPQELLLDISSIHNMKLIGAGAFGKVFRGDLEVDGDILEVAVKTVVHRSEEEMRKFKEEMITMAKISHPNVVRLYGWILNENMIVLEYMSRGNLKFFLQENPQPMSKLVKFMKDIVMGMHHLSEMSLVHRDLAARNILVNEEGVCKVADLGQMIEIPKDGDNFCVITDNTKIPIRWCSPEYLAEKKCSTASDVWSFGILLWEMMNPGKLPYENFSNKEVIRNIMNGFTPTIPAEYPREVQDIMKSCWNKLPQKRPSFIYIFLKLRKVNISSVIY